MLDAPTSAIFETLPPYFLLAFGPFSLRFVALLGCGRNDVDPVSSSPEGLELSTRDKHLFFFFLQRLVSGF